MGNYGTSRRKAFRRFWIRQVLIVVLLLVVLGGAVYLFAPWERMVSSSPATTAASDPISQASAPTLNHPLELGEVLERYYRATGGYEKQLAIRSLRLKGMINREGETIPITMVKQVPGRQRTVLDYDNYSIILASDGQRMWQAIEGRPETAEWVEDGRDVAFLRDSQIASHLLRARENGSRVEMVGMTEVAGFDVYELKVTLQDGYELTYFLDANSFLERKIATQREIDGELVQHETTLSDYRKIDGITVAFRAVNRVGGTSESVLIIKEVDFDIGVLATVFDFPEDAENSG